MSVRRQVINSVLYLGFSIASSALGFCAVLVLTRLLAPQEYGRIGLFFSALYFIAPLVSLSCNGLIAVNKTTLDQQRYRVFQQTCVGLGLVACGLCGVAVLGLWALGQFHDWLLVLTPVYALVRMFSEMAGTEYVAEEKALLYGALTFGSSCVALGFTILLAYTIAGTATMRILAMFLGDLTLLIARYWGRLEVLFRPRLRTEFTRPILEFGVPSMIAVAGAWGLNESDKFIIATTRGLGVTGIYTAAAVMASIMMTFNQSITNALFPRFFQALESRRNRIRTILFQYIAGFTVLSALFAAIVVTGYLWLGQSILPARYRGVQGLFIALMAAGVAVSFFRPISLLADYFRLARTRSIGVLAGGAVTLAVTYFGVRAGSLLWAPIGITTGYLVAAAVLLGGVMITGVGPWRS